MEASPLSVPKTLCENEKAIHRSLCFQGVSSASDICSLEERSIQCSNKCVLNNLEQGVYYAFPPFCLITQVLNKKKDKTKKSILKPPCWQTQLWYPQILSMLIRKPAILPLSKKLLANPSGPTRPLVINQTITLVAWMVSGGICLRKEFLSRQPVLSPIQGDRVLYQVLSHPGRSGLADVIDVLQLVYWTI